MTGGFTIYDTADSRALIKRILREMDADTWGFTVAGRREPHVEPQERAARRRHLRPHGEPRRPERGRVPRDLPALHRGSAPGERSRLRRPHRRDRPPVPRVPRGRGALPAAFPARARRRVPRHQPRPVRADPRAGEAGAAAARARRHAHAGGCRRRHLRSVADRGGRLRPVDLRVPRRRHAQHRRIREGLPAGEGDPARTELPVDAEHPRRRERGDREQLRPRRQEPVHDRRLGREDRRLHGVLRPRRGPVRRRRDRDAQAQRRDLRRRRGVRAHQRADPSARRDLHPLRHPVPHPRRHQVLRACRDQGCDGVPDPGRQPRSTTWLCGAS